MEIDKANRRRLRNFAGSDLDTRERHYAGGITLDPEQKGVIYVSGNVDPHDGSPNATGRFQIHRTELSTQSG